MLFFGDRFSERCSAKNKRDVCERATLFIREEWPFDAFCKQRNSDQPPHSFLSVKSFCCSKSPQRICKSTQVKLKIATSLKLQKRCASAFHSFLTMVLPHIPGPLPKNNATQPRCWKVMNLAQLVEVRLGQSYC